MCLYDKQGRHIPPAAYKLLAFTEDEEDSHLHLRPVGAADPTGTAAAAGSKVRGSKCGGWLYQVEGVETGLAKVRFSAKIQPLQGEAYTLSTGNFTVEVGLASTSLHPGHLTADRYLCTIRCGWRLFSFSLSLTLLLLKFCSVNAGV